MFGRYFNTESPFWQAVARIADIILLNILLIVTSLPLVTIGAAMTATYDTVWHIQDNRGGGTIALYFQSFRQNFRQATALWLITCPLVIGVAAMWLVLPPQEQLVAKVLVSIVILLVFPFPWFLQARFENPILATLKNSLLIPLVRLPYSLGVLAIAAGFCILTVSVAGYLPQALPPLLLGGWPIVVYATMPLLVRAVSLWVPEEPVEQA